MESGCCVKKKVQNTRDVFYGIHILFSMNKCNEYKTVRKQITNNNCAKKNLAFDLKQNCDIYKMGNFWIKS